MLLIESCPVAISQKDIRQTSISPRLLRQQKPLVGSGKDRVFERELGDRIDGVVHLAGEVEGDDVDQAASSAESRSFISSVVSWWLTLTSGSSFGARS